MIKRTILLSMAAYGSAASLRGDGVEEVGEQMEHFPPADYGMNAERRLIEEDDGSEWVVTSQIYDESESPEGGVMGHWVEDNAILEWEGDEDAEDWQDGEDDPVDYFEAVEEDLHFDAEYELPEYAGKEDTRDTELTVLVGTDLLGEAVDQRDRREAACGENKSEFKITLKTDEYGFENKWGLYNAAQNTKLASGPPAGKNYADNSVYAGRWCLPPGVYKFQITDTMSDGFCGGGSFGCGMLKLELNGQSVGKMQNDNSKWNKKDYPFTVAPGSSRIDGVGNGNGNGNGNSNSGKGQWCSKVARAMGTDSGTCTLSNGQRGHRVRMTIKADKYGDETRAQISRGGSTRMSFPANVPSNTQKSLEDCLPAGKYTLKVIDQDGVCCRHGQGFFKLEVNGKELLNGGSFTSSIEHVFQLGYDWVNTMNERDCEWWWAHDYRRQDWHQRCYPGNYCNKEYRHLKWSTSLKADAADYARRLLDTCDTNGIKHDKTDQGENLAKNKGSGDWGALYEADKVTKRFVDNEEFWGWNRNAHLTQAMWYPTRYIGCAESVKNMGGNKMCRMQVCRYAKAGNCMMGQYNSDQGNNWMKPMMADDSPCGPMCTPGEGCYH